MKKKESPSILMENDNSSSESEIDLHYADEDLELSEPEDMYVTVGNHVIIRYQGEYYPGLVLKKDDEGAEIKSMQRAGFDWEWSSKDDILYYYYNEDILKIIDEPQLKNNGGCSLLMECQNTNDFFYPTSINKIFCSSVHY